MHFTLTPEQEVKYSEWRKNHKCNAPYTTIGGIRTFMFTPTGLGDITKVRCICGAEIDLTESEDW